MAAFSCRNIRTPMLAASIFQTIISVAVTILGAADIGLCRIHRHGGWSLVYGSALFSFSAVATAAVHGRQRRIAIFSLVFGMIISIIVLFIEWTSYFCVNMRGGVNREAGMCRNVIESFNSCAWTEKWLAGSSHFESDHPIRFTLLFLVTGYFVFGAGIITSALTEAGRHDLCQFEEAMRELTEANALLTYRRRARRNRILTQYISRAKPEEGESYPTKVLHFFGFGTDVEPVPLTDRKVQFYIPRGS